MKLNRLLSTTTLLLLVLFAVDPACARVADKQKVLILATGGTIAGSSATGTEAGYTAGKIGIDVMIDAVPGIEELADISGEQLANVGSQDMSVAIWLKLANRINKAFSDKDVDGIVITHGTDTQEETAFFLNLVVKSDKPVVLTGSMRPSTAVSAEGPLNLYNAVAVAADPNARGRGVLVVMNDNIHGAHSVTKTNTTAVETFKSPIYGVIGMVHYGQSEFFRKPFRKHTTKADFSLEGVDKLPRVDIIYACADMSADMIEAATKAGAKGVVVAGVGNGNMNAEALATCKRVAQEGVVVVRSTRVPTGTVGRNIEVNDDDLRTIASDELNPQKARILLMLALLKDRSLEEIQELYYTY
ncbi:type II asparaginase [Marinilabiliaceae bacterium JC017]|nr:type II asparaginase [Marinilabiliaceae bacterium JC017]